MLKSTITLFCMILLSWSSIKAERPINDEWDKVVNLKGFWKFAIGDYPEWAAKDFDDSEWEKIRVPSNWEDQGFYDYDGYAWYRTKFEIDAFYEGENLYLNLGYIDDVDEVYLNGELIGFSGVFPPNYATAYNSLRIYNIPKDLIDFSSENTIAIRVYDLHIEGGIVGGDIGVYRNLDRIHPEIQLAGSWKFRIGDDMEYANIDYDHSNWDDIMVPGFWMHYGYGDYDGFAWYRKTFNFDEISATKYVLVAGKIDDIDQIYLNGKLVGETGDMDNEFFSWDEYSKVRVYYLNENDLLANQKNTIAVRVLDAKQHGGIYEGPVGIMKLKTFQQYWRQKERSEKKRKSVWDLFFD